jgi:hypothetical protein
METGRDPMTPCFRISYAVVIGFGPQSYQILPWTTKISEENGGISDFWFISSLLAFCPDASVIEIINVIIF